MSLKQTIDKDYIDAFKAKDDKAPTLKLIRAAIKQIEIDTRQELSDEDIIQILSKEAKKRQESIEAYKQGNREDLAKKEEDELKIIQSYLPKQLSNEELEQIIQKVIQDQGATSMQEFGKIMGAVMAQVKGKADGNQVQEIVKKLLQ